MTLLACGLACATVLMWSLLRADGSRSAAVLRSPERLTAREALAALDPSAQLPARYELPDQSPSPSGESALSGTAPRALVRVHGQVRKAGRPLEEYELSFQRLDRDPEEEDWDSTDGDGCYEVELEPGRYEVRHEEDGPSVTSVVIDEAEREVQLDIDLPR